MESMMKICKALDCDIGDIVEMTENKNAQQVKVKRDEYKNL